MASNFAEALQQGYAFGAQQREDRERRSKLAELAGLSSKVIGGDYEATNRAYALDPQAARTYQSEGDRRREQLAGMARGWKSVPSEQRQAYYERFIAPAVAQMGFGDLGQYDEASVDGIATQILAAYGGGTPGGAVQSTFVDNQGNRVAIMRDGSTQVLGQNAPNNQIIDTGNGFYGVNKGNLSAAPVMVGGQPQQAPQPSLQAGLYQTPAGMVRIGDDLTPEMQQAALADIQAGGTAQNVQLPPRNVGPQQFGAGQQLRSAPKQSEQFSTLTAQEVQALGLPQGTVAQRSPTGQVQIVNKPRDLPSNGQIIDNGDGTTTFIPAGKTTEGERNAAGFYQRMVNSRGELDALTRAGYDPTNAQDRFGSALDDTPLIGGLLAPIGRSMTSTEGQQYQQAAMNWIRANLRKESGAAIGVKEANDEYRNYFPVMGDTPEVIAQKARNRLVVEQAMRSAAGGALAPPTNNTRRSRYQLGQIIEQGGRRYRVTGLSDPNDPDVEEVR